MPSLTVLVGLLFSLRALAAQPSKLDGIFERPVMTRVYQSNDYVLKNSDVDIAEIASSLARLKPTYVSGLLRLSPEFNLTDAIIKDYNTIRSKVLATSPTAKFDVELNLDPKPFNGKAGYPSSDAVVAHMKQINAAIKIDAWWFDFYSTAQIEAPHWVKAVVDYAHGQGQLVGGNTLGNYDSVPPGSDAVAFVDSRGSCMKDNCKEFGFGINSTQVAGLKHNTTSAVILGHLNNNPQDGSKTESCVYIQDWNSTERANYLDYWKTQQSNLGFKFFYPQFFPQCPGIQAFDPLADKLSNKVVGKNGTLFDYIEDLMNEKQ